MLSGLEGEGVRGSKRLLAEKMDSPSKRQRNFKNLLSFWDNPAGVANFKSTYRPKSFVNTTQHGSACTDLPDSDSATTKSVELPLISRENESDQTEGVSNL